MRIINVIVKVLTFPAAFFKGFWEQLICKIMGIPVESKKVFQSGEMAGHIEHELFCSASKSFKFCFFSGFMTFLAGLVFLFPALFGLIYLDVTSAMMQLFILSWLIIAAGLFTNIFPSIEDAIEMWESYKEMNKFAKVILAPAAAIMYAGAYAETCGITFLTNYGFVAYVIASIIM